MVIQGAVKQEVAVGATMSEQLTPRQMFYAPLLSALLFGGGRCGIADIYVHIRDIVPLNARDWESNPVERRLARWHTSLSRCISDLVRIGCVSEDGHARWLLTEKGIAMAREFQLVTHDGVLIERSQLRKRLDDFAARFDRMWKVHSRPNPPAAREGESQQ